MNHNSIGKLILVFVVLLELVIGSVFLFNFYQQKIIHKTQDSDKAAVIRKEGLIFPEEPDFKFYYELKPNREAIESPAWLGYQAKYTFNADGLNDRFDYEVEKPEDTFRIITLGDSFTYGHYVNTEDNWTEQIEDMFSSSKQQVCGYKKVEVINLGMTGWDVPYIAKRYKNVGAKYKPDLIIWFESGSGFTRLNELMNESIDICEKDEDVIYNTSKEFPTKSYYCWKLAQKKMDKEYSNEEIKQIIANNLDNFLSGLNQEKVLFFTFEISVFDDRQKNVLEEWKKRHPETSFLSIVPDLHGLKQTLSDGHPNVQGHKTIASSIYEYLENNVMNQCE